MSDNHLGYFSLERSLAGVEIRVDKYEIGRVFFSSMCVGMMKSEWFRCSVIMSEFIRLWLKRDFDLVIGTITPQYLSIGNCH